MVSASTGCDMVAGLPSAEAKKITEQLYDLDTCDFFAIKALGGDGNNSKRYTVMKDDHLQGDHHQCVLTIRMDNLGDIAVATPNGTQIAQSKNAGLSSADGKIAVHWRCQVAAGEIGSTYIRNNLKKQPEQTQLVMRQRAIHGNHFIIEKAGMNRPFATIFDSRKSAATVVWIDRCTTPVTQGTSSADSKDSSDQGTSLANLLDELLIILAALKFYYAVYKMHHLPVSRELLSNSPPAYPQPDLCQSHLETLQFVTLRPFGIDVNGNMFTEVLDLFTFDVLIIVQTNPSMVTTSFRDTFGELLFQLRRDKTGNCKVSTNKMIIGQICQNCLHINHTKQSKLTFIEERDRTFVFREETTSEVMAEVCSYFYNNIASVSLSPMSPLHKVVVLAAAALLAQVEFEFHTQCLPQIAQYSYLKPLKQM